MACQFIWLVLFTSRVYLIGSLHFMGVFDWFFSLQTCIWLVPFTSQVCTFIFLTEMILKLIALSPSGYVKSRWNIFDGVVVLVSILDIVLTIYQAANNTGTSVLRTFRLVRTTGILRGERIRLMVYWGGGVGELSSDNLWRIMLSPPLTKTTALYRVTQMIETEIEMVFI